MDQEVGAGVLGSGYVVALGLMDAPWQLLVASCIASAGVGIGYAAMPTLILDSVPMHEAASHGCVRNPEIFSVYIYNWIHLGDAIHVYN